MRSTDWGQTLKETLAANPGLKLGEISKLASKAHHEKRQALATKTKIEGKTNPTTATKRKCTRWEYPGESKALEGLVGADPALPPTPMPRRKRLREKTTVPHPTARRRVTKGDVN